MQWLTVAEWVEGAGRKRRRMSVKMSSSKEGVLLVV